LGYIQYKKTKIMKHIKIFEDFSGMGMDMSPGARLLGKTGMETFRDDEPFEPESIGRPGQFAVCVQGDASAAVGLVGEEGYQKIKRAIEAGESKYPGFSGDVAVYKIPVDGMAYIVHDINGDWEALPEDTDPYEYLYRINSRGLSDSEDHDSRGYDNEEDRIFTLVDGKMIEIDHHSNTICGTVDQYINHTLDLM